MRKLGLVLVAMILGSGCDKAPPLDASVEVLPVVRVAAVEQGELANQWRFSSILRPAEQTRLAFQSDGIIAQRPVKLGQSVEQGELIAALENTRLKPEYQAAVAGLAEVRSELVQARNDLIRSQALISSGAVGEERVERQTSRVRALEAALRRQQAELASAQEALTDATLVAPYAGVISAIPVEQGEFVSRGQTVAVIGDALIHEAEFRLPVDVLQDVHIGDQLEVAIPQLRNRAFGAVVQELSSVGDPQTGLYSLVLSLAEDAHAESARSGQQVELSLNSQRRHGLILPLAAIVDPIGNAPRVYRLRGQQVEVVALQVLQVYQSKVLVAGELAAGERVVVAGHRTLSEAQRVRIVP